MKMTRSTSKNPGAAGTKKNKKRVTLYKKTNVVRAKKNRVPSGHTLTKEETSWNYRQFLSFVEQAPLSIAMFDQDMNYLAVSRRWIVEYGRGYTDLIGHNHYAVHPDIPANWKDAHRRGLAGESLKNDEDLWVQGDGTKSWLRWAITPWINEDGQISGIVISAEDITERKRAEEALRESEEKYRLLFGNNPLPMWIYDLETLKFLRVNDAAVKRYGYSKEEFMAMTIKDIRPSEDIPRLIENISSITKGIDEAGIWIHCKKDGTLIEVEIVSHAVEFDGRRCELVLANDITQRRLAEQALRESEQRYRALFEDSPVSIWEEDFSQVKAYFDSLRLAGVANFREYFENHPEAVEECIRRVQILDVNRSTLNLMQAQDKRELLTTLSDSLSEDAIPTMMGELISLAEGKLSYESDEEFTTMQGEKRYVYFRLTVAPGYEETLGKVFVSIVDFTERKQAEAKIHRHLDELEALYENGLAVNRLLTLREIGEKVIQTVTRYLSWHHAAIRLRKGDGDELELIAFSVPQLKEDDREDVAQNFRTRIDKVGQGMSGWVVKTGIPIRTGDVHEYPQYVAIYKGIQSGMYMPLQVGGKTIGSISVESELPNAFTLQDERLLSTLSAQAAVAFENARLYQTIQQELSERQRAEVMLEQERNSLAQRVDERTSELISANTNLARALRVKDEFLANMSHELRTPLNAILGLSESLGEQVAGPLNGKQKKYVQTITESGHHLLSLINDILDLAKIEAGQVTLDISKVDVRLLCESSLRMVKQIAQKKNQEVSLRIDEKFGSIWADERRLKQMIVNLLSNAVKFTPEGGKIGLEVHGDKEVNRVLITVWDRGIGIAENDIARLFKPFVQLSTGLARESTGTGLGLTLVAQMARLHGGGVSVSSVPGEGSRFTLILPWEPALAMDAEERMKISGKFRAVKNTGENERRKILLIEDTPEVLMMVRDYLEAAGYNLAVAKDGLEGIAQAKHFHPDLILMDLQMPRMDGFEATRKLRADPDFKTTPIIALTALAMQGDRERCLAAGMDEYITKPVNLKGLIKIIEASLSHFQDKKSKLQ